MVKAKAKTADPPEDGRGMEETLADLGFDNGATSEDAAVDAANDVASSTVVVVEEDTIVPDPVGDEIPPEPEGPPSVKLPDLPPIPPEEAPEGRADVPPPKPPRSKKRDMPQGAAGRVGKALAAKVPGAESVKVYRRSSDGKLWYVNTFTTADLSTHDGFEGFLTEYVKPEHGPGEYVLMAPDKKDPSKEFELGTVRLLGTTAVSADQGLTGVLQTLLAQNQSRDADWVERMEKQMMQPQQNPIDLLKGVMEVSEKVNGKAGASEAVAKAEAASNTQTMMEVMQSSGDKSMQMMMMMQQQAQAAAAQQQQMMMTLLAKPKEEDPMMKLLLMKLLKDDESGGSALPPPPPPPSPPQDNTVALITALAGFMGAMGGGGDGGDDDFKEFLKTQLAQNASQGLSMKETIELLTKSQGQQGNGFKDAVENMAAIMNITQSVNRQNEGGPAAGVWDAVASLLSNRDFAGAIANTIRAKTDQSGSVQKTGIDMAQQRLAFQQRLALKQQQQAILAAQHQAAAGAPVPQPGVTPSAAPAHPQQETPIHLVPPVPTEAPDLITDDQQRVAEAMARQRQLPQLPSDTHTHINNIAIAEDDAERVERTVRMLIYFSEFDEWRVFMEQILGFIREGERKDAMKYLGSFFEGLATIHLVDHTLGKEILRTMEEHFEALQTNLHDFELDGDRLITGDDLLQTPDGTRKTSTAPRDNDGDPEEEDDPDADERGDDGDEPA